MQDKRKKVSLVSRGAASSPFIFRHFFFYSPVRYHEGLRVLVFFLIVPSQKKERFPQLRVWCLLVRVFASVARERERERDVRRPFFFSFVALLGRRPFSIASGAVRARVEREKDFRATFQPYNFLQIKQPDPYRPSPFSDRIYRETKDHEKKKKKRERER